MKHPKYPIPCKDPKCCDQHILMTLADQAICNDDTIIYDVAANFGQIVGNVKHMQWFRKAVAEEIRDMA